MNIKQTITATAAILLMASTVNAQGVLGKLKDKAVKAGQKKVEQVVTKKAEKTLEGAVLQTTDHQPTATGRSSESTQAVGAPIAMPKTGNATFDKASLGLTPNIDAAKPTSIKTGKSEYSALQVYTPQPQKLSRIYDKGLNRRQDNLDAAGRVTDYVLYLTNPSNPADITAYYVYPSQKFIQKMPSLPQRDSIHILTSLEDGKLKIEKDEELVKYEGRWCVKRHVKFTETERHAENVNSRREYDVVEGGTFNENQWSYVDCETGINLCERSEGGSLLTRGIEFGTQPDSLFVLPKDYKMVDAMQEAEGKLGDMMDKLGKLGLGKKK